MAPKKPTDAHQGPSSADSGDEKTVSTHTSPSIYLSSCCQWYSWWLKQQLDNEPKESFLCLPDHNPGSENKGGASYDFLWQEVWQHMIANTPLSIDDLIAHLAAKGAIASSSKPTDVAIARDLVFATIGWQTMLYRSDRGSCPQSQLAIVDVMDGHSGQCHMALKQNQTACKRKMHDFLLGFGVLLPPPNFSALEAAEEKQAFKALKSVDPSSFNAQLLTSIGRLEIMWVDSLACHLELNRDSNTLFLFRYPSFCASQIAFGKSGSRHKSVIHACAAPYSSKQWGTEDDVEQMLNETLLSYRLLFGQRKAGRQLFRKLVPFEGIPETGRDQLLSSLCGQKHTEAKLKIPERDLYDLSRHFSIYRSKLAILQSHLTSRKPRSWKELWLDKRDSASWLTFWAVLVFGGLSIILAAMQVILQIVQIKTQH